MKILIWLQSGKIPFFSELYKILKKKGHDIKFIARDKIIEKNIKFFLKDQPDISKSIFVEKKKIFISKNIVKLAKNYEKKYNFNISLYLSQDRALGRGYLINADNYPEIKRSTWSYLKKINSFMLDFLYYEEMINNIKPKLILTLAPVPLIYLICRKKNIKYYSLSYSKLGERFFWSDNEFGSLNHLKKLVKKKLKSKKIKRVPNNIYNLIKKNTATFAHTVNKYSYFLNFKNFIKFTILFILREIRGLNKKDSYKYFSWVLRYLRIPISFNYLEKNSINNFKKIKKRYVYIPMHLEPEMALQNFSPEFSNTFEMITWISKNLPTQYLIVLKEHPEMYGIRSINYYKKLRQIPNVVFANPKTSSFELIKNSLAVATITGTAGFEAIFFKKQVLSFGIHQIINNLPTVYFCTNYYDTSSNLKKIFQKKNDNIFALSQSVLYYTIYNNSFELKDIDKLDDAFYNVKKNLKKRVKDLSTWKNLANISIKHLNI
tara:strand:- start:1957 stop:3426 length:1470 start_codon:yes stop_codon:yes gene_type:complete